jgi:hypothetical protein
MILLPSSLQTTRIIAKKSLFTDEVQLEQDDLMKSQHLYQQQNSAFIHQLVELFIIT